MARLPVPGGDAGSWGDILNDFLSAAHNADGTLKDNAVSTNTIQDNSVSGTKLQNGTVSESKLNAGSGTDGQVLAKNSAAAGGFNWVSGGGVAPDATTSTKGIVQLAGDLGGTATAPTVPGLATKANDSTVVHISGNEAIGGIKNFTGTLQIGGQAAVATNDARLTDQRVPTNASVTPAKLIADAPASGEVLSYNGTGFEWVVQSGGGGDPAMGGDLSGVASNAQIVANAVGTTELATNAVTTIKITDANVTEPKLAIANSPSNSQVLSWNGSAMEWTAPVSGSGGPGSMGAILVASNDAPANIKAYADYVCTGTNDEVFINLALDKAAPLQSRNALMPAGAQQTATVQLTGGRFNISAPIQMHTGVWLRGMGFVTELRAVNNNGAGVITLSAPEDHLCRVSDMWLNGNFGSGGSCSGIDFDMTDASPDTSSYPSTSPDSYHHIHDLYILGFVNNSSRHGIYLHATGSSTRNRGNIIDRVQIRGGDIPGTGGNGIYLDSASDCLVSNCHVGNAGGSAFMIAGGNTKITGCKSFYSETAGFTVTSGRSVITGCESQDDVVGLQVSNSNGSFTGLIIDTCQNDGIILSSSSISLTGFSIFLRSGGRYTTQTNGLRFVGSLNNIECVGRVNPANITNPIVGVPVAPSFMRVVDGTSVVSVG